MARRFNVKPIKRSKKALGLVKDKLPSGATEEEPTSPRITNETVAEHREEVLSGGRRFLYPLQHSKHKVVIISAALITVLLISMFILSWLLLYRWQSTSNFAYRVTEIFPVPIARVDGDFVPYERYLFEFRSTIHYYTNHAQEGVDITGPDGERILADAKAKALEKAKLDMVAEKIAKENNVTVSQDEIKTQIAIIQKQGGIDDTTGVLKDVLSDFYGWDLDDLQKVVRLQLIRQKIPAALDAETNEQASQALNELKDGGKFADIAKKYSDDVLTKDKAGNIGEINRDNKDLPPQFIEAAFALEEGQTTSELVKTPFGLHIIKVEKKSDNKIDVSHVLFRYFNVNDYLKTQLQEKESKDYVTF